MSFPFETLRRSPDVEGPGLVAVDAADRLLLDESRSARLTAPADGVVVIGDSHGALALGAAWERPHDDGVVRVHQDALAGERALARNAERLEHARPGLSTRVAAHPTLDASLVQGARLVLLRLPRSLDALRELAGLIAAHADPAVVVYAGGRLKHMSVAMNDVLGTFFTRVDVSHARQKSRVLVARGAHDGRDPVPEAARVAAAGPIELEVRAFGGAFGGAHLDAGTRLLLAHLPSPPVPAVAASATGSADDPLLDLACGTGLIGAWLARRHPSARVWSSDQSAVAVASAMQTAAANGVEDRMQVVRDDALSQRPAGSASFVTLNPPFHSGAAVTDRIAPHLFADVARVLRPGGELWCVWNSPRAYRPVLERLVGPTRQVARDPRFTVTVSTRR